MVAGEALIDLVISESGAVEASLGGAPFNTSRAVARLGGEVSFVGAISTDRFGSMLVAQLAADGVSVSAVAVCVDAARFGPRSTDDGVVVAGLARLGKALRKPARATGAARPPKG